MATVRSYSDAGILPIVETDWLDGVRTSKYLTKLKWTDWKHLRPSQISYKLRVAFAAHFDEVN